MKALKSDSAVSEFDRLTCVNPHFAAHHILHEVRAHYWMELPSSLEDDLARGAVTVFGRNRRWRKKIQGRRGPDYLRMFMRHWLSSLLFKRRHPLFRELPDS